MPLDRLTGWTPVALNLAQPPGSIDWGDLRGTRFREPFFDQTVETWAGGESARLIRTDLAPLLELGETTSLSPAALIFHLSRCGSTLLSRLLGTIPGVLAISEPAPLNSFLLGKAQLGDAETVSRLLRGLVRALGQKRFGDETRYVLKLSSWNVAHLGLYRQAFPAARIIWLQRAPGAVLASLLREPAGWARLQPGQPSAAAETYRQALASYLKAALDTDPDKTLYLDYAELPDAVWTRVAPFLGWVLDQTDIARMQQEAGFDAKQPERRAFDRARAQADARPPELNSLAETLMPLYRELDRRRQRQIEARV